MSIKYFNTLFLCIFPIDWLRFFTEPNQNLDKMIQEHFFRHNIDPFLFRFPPSFDFLPTPGIPWYGTMYLLGFLIAYFLLERLRKTDFIPLETKEETLQMMYSCFYGVLIGGRLGHFLFYQPEIFITNPLEIFRIWNGGMASHGGVLGVIIALYLYAKKRKLSPWRVWDAGAMITIPGLGLGRIGNFINGEMPGKITNVPWAIIFPQYDLNPRHPAQLYQALGEGLFLFIILWIILPRSRFKKGFHLSMFFIFYGIQRIVTESYREMSSELASSLADALTQGQVLSIGMIVIGAYLFYLTQYKNKEQNLLGQRE